MFAYNYHPQTREYLGIETAQKDPKQPGEYLLPGHATFTAPPEEREEYARIWNGTWEYAEDHRGQTIWKDYDTSAVVDQIGPVPEGWSLERPARKLTRQELTEMIYQEKARIAYGGITIRKDGLDYLFATDQNSISLCAAMRINLTGQPDHTVLAWKVYRDGKPEMLSLTKSEFETVVLRAMTMINAAFQTEGELYERLDSLDEMQYEAFQSEIKAAFQSSNGKSDI